MNDTSFFTARDGAYVPSDRSRGYWKRDSLHGRLIVGLLGFEIERLHGAPGFVPARLTVDMFRLAPFAPAEIQTRLVRESGRLRLAEADLVVGGDLCARASCQFLRATEAPPGSVWSAGPWTAPHPRDVAPQPGGGRPDRIFDRREIVGTLGGPAPKQLWMSERFDLVEGVALTPFVRVAVAADFASPFIHGGDAGIRYINTDVTMHLHRLPAAEWIGFEVTGHEASEGIAVGYCRLHDVDGPIGFASCSALSNERRRTSGDAEAAASPTIAARPQSR